MELRKILHGSVFGLVVITMLSISCSSSAPGIPPNDVSPSNESSSSTYIGVGDIPNDFVPSSTDISFNDCKKIYVEGFCNSVYLDEYREYKKEEEKLLKMEQQKEVLDGFLVEEVDLTLVECIYYSGRRDCLELAREVGWEGFLTWEDLPTYGTFGTPFTPFPPK